jgi:hypothetical protein
MNKNGDGNEAKGRDPQDVVARGVGAVVSENFWALLFALGAGWYGWMAAVEGDLETKLQQAEAKIAALAERVARLEGQGER